MRRGPSSRTRVPPDDDKRTRARVGGTGRDGEGRTVEKARESGERKMNPIDALFRVDVRRGVDAISAPRISLAIDDRENDRWIESRAESRGLPCFSAVTDVVKPSTLFPFSFSSSLSHSCDRDSFARRSTLQSRLAR